MTELALAHSLAVLGDRWTMQIVAELLRGARRFGELEAAVGGIAPNVLTGRLRQLERAGIVVASPYSRRPLRLSYNLTESGRELEPAIALLTAWGARQLGADDRPVHQACGTPMETRLYCPSCERPVDQPSDDTVAWW